MQKDGLSTATAKVALGPQAKRRETEKRHAHAERRKSLRNLAKSRDARTGRRESLRKRLGSPGSGGLDLAPQTGRTHDLLVNSKP